MAVSDKVKTTEGEQWLSILDLMSDLAGTSFPGSPVDGQPFYRTDHAVPYHYDSTAAGWLSDLLYGFDFGINADTAATNFLKYAETAASATMSTTIGYVLEFAAKFVGAELVMAASGTCTVQIGTGGSGLTGASLALSSQQAKSDNTLMSNTLSANSVFSMAVTSGTIEGPARGKFWCRRFET